MSPVSKFKRSKNLREFLVFIVDQYLEHSDDYYFSSKDFREDLRRRYKLNREVDILVFGSSGLVNALNECMDEHYSKSRSTARLHKEKLAEILYMLDGWKDYLDDFSFERRNGMVYVKHG